MRLLPFFFIAFPILEIWVLVLFGSQIGATYVVLLVLLTAVIGFYLLKQQGLNTIFRLRNKIIENKLPIHEIFEGLVISIGGILLITPGFLTDSVGFLCLLPKVRKIFLKFILSIFKSNNFDFMYKSKKYDQDDRIIDGEYTIDQKEIRK